MNNETAIDTETYEEVYRGYEIFIEPNPDRRRGGFVWSVCNGDSELGSEIAFTIEDAQLAAYGAIASLVKG